MHTSRWMVAVLITMAMVSKGAAQDIVAFANGYLTFTNENPALYYTVQFRPNLTGTNDWDGTYDGLKDIRSANSTITVPVGVFYRVVGSDVPAQQTTPAHVPRTGQTNEYRAGDDGTHQAGAVWPEPRFTITTNGADEVVTDRLTSLMWVRAPHNVEGNNLPQDWSSAIDFCDGLTFATYSDWRLPNVRELQSLIDYGNPNWPALPTPHPFVNIAQNDYWSSTTRADYTEDAWSVGLHEGQLVYEHKGASLNFVWPVRDTE